ncbi:hypothetical protein EYF80_039960 [Liparis tanakae]|uniref:Uncharacterized protein n=1 Tax=Liparis tanakae TaxID=230148 RepID=A0A4Z2G8E0_9TELE|nr:hypothetical protein EYF80_039960 [Liparis tanakae]
MSSCSKEVTGVRTEFCWEQRRLSPRCSARCEKLVRLRPPVFSGWRRRRCRGLCQEEDSAPRVSRPPSGGGRVTVSGDFSFFPAVHTDRRSLPVVFDSRSTSLTPPPPEGDVSPVMAPSPQVQPALSGGKRCTAI